MALPLWMLKGLQIHKFQKLGLAFIFSLAIVCVALDILRTAEALASNQALYTVLEINFVVIVSCLPTYRALLNIGQQGRSGKASQYNSGGSNSMFSSLRRPSLFSSWKRMESGTPVAVDGGGSYLPRDLSRSGAESVSKDIHVTRDFVLWEGGRDAYPLDPLDVSSELRIPESTRPVLSRH